MEVFILDDLFRRTGKVIDKYISLIWTERWRDKGDFQLVVTSNQENRTRFTGGTRLAFSESVYVMEIETAEDGTDDEGKSILKIAGPSIEDILDDRVAKGSMADLTTEPTWDITGTPAFVARKIFHDICVTGTLALTDIIPNVVENTLTGTNPEPPDPITVNLEPQTVYQAIKDICANWNLGFRLVRLSDSSTLNFDIYPGSDRTTEQTILPAVIFSPGLDNLKNVKELKSVSGSKNVAYVFSPAGFKVVYSPNVDSSSLTGLTKRILVVNATDITEDSTEDVDAALLQRGIEELNKTKPVSQLDGEISQSSKYKYGVDYFLGDLVESRNIDGVHNIMRVEEQIFASDAQGIRSYPTLAIDTFINTGTWAAWMPGKHWADLSADSTHWSDL